MTEPEQLTKEVVSPTSTADTGTPQAGFRGHLGLWDAASIIVGIVIGAGIYETAPFIFQNAGGPGRAMLVWVLAGVLSVVGAMCYAELATTYPRLGGDYYFLRRAYGPWAGFLFGWAQLTVIMTGSIGMMAYIFADYAVKLFGTAPTASPAFAAAAVLVLSLTNLAGVKSGQRTQNLLTGLKVLGLSAIVLAGVFWPAPAHAPKAAANSGGGSFGLAMVLVLYTYGGWNDAAFVVAEMKDKRRNIPRALLLGTAGVALIYIIVNAAYLSGLGYEGASGSQAIAADVLHRALGNAGAKVMSLLVMVSALGALNGLVLTGARIYAAMGRDFRIVAPLARWHPRLGTPVWSILVQMAITLAMVLQVGTASGRAGINALLQKVGFEGVRWEGHGGFDALLSATAPIFWLFFLLTGLSLFVLRFKDRGVERPFSVPFFPLPPLIFCGMCGYMIYSAAAYAGRLICLGLAPVVLGLFVLAFFGQGGKPAAQSASED
jgi:basic amino acid/polyamine antiporter, APA family